MSGRFAKVLFVLTRAFLIRRFRRQLGTQEQAAKLLGTTVRSISRWERGKAEPHRAFTDKLRKRLGRKILPPEVVPVYQKLQSAANDKVARAILDKKLPRLVYNNTFVPGVPAPELAKACCVDCGTLATEYDHPDYLNPMAVEPVCKQCNLFRGIAIYTFLDHPEYWSKFDWGQH